MKRSSRSPKATMILLLGVVGAGGVGCSSAAPSTEVPTASSSSSAARATASSSVAVDNEPTAGSRTKAEPGGDAADPELAALTMLAEGDVTRRWDKPEVLATHLVDSKLWRRVKSSSLPARVMFRYGDETHALAVVLYQPSEGPDDPTSCLKRFMSFAADTASTYDISYDASPVYPREQTLDGVKKPMVIQLAEGRVNAPFFQDDYVGGIAAYQSFPGTCLVQAIAFIATDHPAAARRARDRWVNDAAPLLQWDMKKIGDKAPPFEDR